MNLRTNKSLGRLYEEDNLYHDDFLEDMLRLVSSNAFKRMDSKTQVFRSNHGDHYRTRLTHSIEVGTVAKIMSSTLGLNSILSEVIALAHDIGHPPFGHSGEDAINEIIAEHGCGYNHNAHAFKLLTRIENRSREYTGLNLTINTLDGILKHNGPMLQEDAYVKRYNDVLGEQAFNLKERGSLEAQVAAISDDIAYNNHDIEDGVRSGIINLDDLGQLPIFGDLLSSGMSLKEAKDASECNMIGDVVENSRNNLTKYNIKTADDVVQCDAQIIDFSHEMHENIRKIRVFLREKLYKSTYMQKYNNDSKDIIKCIFENIAREPKHMKKKWYDEYVNIASDEERIELICDYIAGMTDTFAINLAKYFQDTSIMI